jgi:ubiquinone/menaquinone biosynthesis C-methylase UbiE
MSRTLSHLEAKAFYDWFGSKQDWQRFYEDPPIEVMVAHADFEHAHAVVELGCGTGRLAAELLGHHMPASATYLGFDVSETMVKLAATRLQPWGGRAGVHLSDGSPRLPIGEGICDRYLCMYVLDLLDDADIQAVIRDARRVLKPGGRVCLASLTVGQTVPSRVVSRLWRAAHAWRPQLVGGCRPILLEKLLDDSWHVEHRQVVCAFGVCTEVLIAA